jgi:hypothetical protein
MFVNFWRQYSAVVDKYEKYISAGNDVTVTVCGNDAHL